MVNWLYTPGITYKELAEEAKPQWTRYLNFAKVSDCSEKDPLESADTWQAQIAQATSFLTDQAVENQPVQFIVETQVLLTPVLKGRHQTHFLYKVCRAETPNALYSDFRSNRTVEALSYQEVEDRALNEIRSFMAETHDVNRQHEDLQGATML
jgi:hypothetical protein